MKNIFTYLILSIGLICCKENNNNNDKAKDATKIELPTQKAFDTILDNQKVSLYYLKNKNGLEVAITNYGGRIVSLLVPNKKAEKTDVIIGPGTIQEFISSKEPYFGAIIGRYGNRIAQGNFSIESKSFKLNKNNGVNHLHGGLLGFQYKVWDVELNNPQILKLHYLSKDGEEGYPGNLNVYVSYELNDSNELIMDYQATTDKKTVINLTNHAFFNLNGVGEITNHILYINAANYTPIDSTLIPIGNIESVANTPFDFQNKTRIGERILLNNEQLTFGKGYDHNFVLNKDKNKLSLAATAIGDKSGIQLDVYTQEPGLQFYSGNFMQSKNKLKRNTVDDFRTAFCLESQHYPNSPNQKNFPSTILMPNAIYKTKTIYKFSAN